MPIGITNKRQRIQTMTKPGNQVAPGQINMIGEGTVLEGTLRARGDVRISGRIIGKLEVAGKAIVAQEGAVDGELQAESADVAGAVDGQINVRERIVLKSTARVEGDINAGRLVVEEGAVFVGKCAMEGASRMGSVVETVVENGAGATAA